MTGHYFFVSFSKFLISHTQITSSSRSLTSHPVDISITDNIRINTISPLTVIFILRPPIGRNLYIVNIFYRIVLGRLTIRIHIRPSPSFSPEILLKMRTNMVFPNIYKSRCTFTQISVFQTPSSKLIRSFHKAVISHIIQYISNISVFFLHIIKNHLWFIDGHQTSNIEKVFSS